MFERLIACILIVLLLPLIVLISALILLEGCLKRASAGPVFYVEERMSQGKPFPLIKFRTFKPAAFKKILNTDRESYGITAVENRPENLTKVGAWIKKIYFDEIPQLINIVKGEMAFVGPRPLINRLYEEHLKNGNRAKTSLKAGWTGPWQVNKGNVSSLADIIAVENDYLEKVSQLNSFQKMRYDILFIFKTLKVLFEAKSI